MSRAPQPTLVSWARTAYDPAPSFEKWVDALTDRASCLVEGGHGAAGRILDVGAGGTRGGYSIHVGPAQVEDALREHELRSAHRLDFLLEARAMSSSRRGASVKFPDEPYFARMKRHFDAAGVHDMWHLTAFDGLDAWVTVGLLVPRRLSPEWSVRAWAQARAHFTQAVRLQRRASDLGLMARGWLETEATISHRDALRERVRHLDASGGTTGSAELVWKGLVDGSWSLLDRHDHAGRRFLVAAPNPPGARDLRALSDREACVAALAADGRSDKWIGWVLGIERTTAANLLRAALGKLGLESTVALARAFHASGGDSHGPLDDGLPSYPAPSLAPRVHPCGGDAVVLAFDLSASSPGAELLIDKLSPGERRVAALAVQGLGDVEIARSLGRSRHTVSNQLRRAYAKLHIGGRVELAAVMRDCLRER